MSYSDSHWRNHAAPIIAKVIAEHKGEDENIIRRALREAYPFGERKYHPYKIWNDEVHVQLGKKPHVKERRMSPERKNQRAADETVGNLFDPEATA